MRIYLPVTFGDLARAAVAGELGPPPLFAYAVTPALREWYASGDAEELEYAAMTDAARECLRLIAREAAAPARRVVVAADVAREDLDPTPDLHPGAVVVNAAVPLAGFASVHVDDPSAAADVRAAAKAVAAADGGDADAQFTVDGVEDHELQWYATQEIADLLAGE
jgi:hypothetical protein